MRKCSFRKGAWSFGGPQEENVDIYGQALWVNELLAQVQSEAQSGTQKWMSEGMSRGKMSDLSD